MPLLASDIPTPPGEGQPALSARESPETLALLAQRRSTKIAHFCEPGPTGADLQALIALAARVPDHGKLGPWRFVVIEGEARARAGVALARVIENDDGVDDARIAQARSWFLRAPVCVMIVSTAAQHAKIPEWEQILSAGAAGFALQIAAHAAGYASCWLTEWPAYDARARAALGLAEHERIAGFAYVGSTREPAIERVRADIASRVTRF